MIDLKNVLEVVNESVILPLITITFLLLMYVVYYLGNRDPDVIRSRIFLKYAEFKKAFILLSAFALILMIHVALIYVPHFFYFEDYPLLKSIQRFCGFLLTLILITFVYVLIKSIK